MTGRVDSDRREVHLVHHHPGEVDAIGALDVIATAESYLAAHPDPAVRSIATWLHDAPGLLEHLAGLEGARGHSARIEHQVAARNALLRELGQTMTAKAIADELRRYHRSAWPRDRATPRNPYRDGDRRATLWRIFRLRDAALGERACRKILSSNGI
jgi:hypothetical protein